MCDKQRLRPACAYAQSDQSPCWSPEYSMNTKLLTKHHLELLSLKGGGTGSSESTLVKMPHCWKSHVTVQICSVCTLQVRVSLSQPHVLRHVQHKEGRHRLLHLLDLRCHHGLSKPGGLGRPQLRPKITQVHV